MPKTTHGHSLANERELYSPARELTDLKSCHCIVVDDDTSRIMVNANAKTGFDDFIATLKEKSKRSIIHGRLPMILPDRRRESMLELFFHVSCRLSRYYVLQARRCRRMERNSCVKWAVYEQSAHHRANENGLAARLYC